MAQTKPTYATINQLAARFNVSARTIHHWLKGGLTIDGVIKYGKLNPENRNSPYVIEVNPRFFDGRTKLEKPVAETDIEDYLK